jgi:predicted DNA-binding transcriptional regulator AlpA
MPQSTRKLLNINTVSEMIGVSPATTRRYVDRPELGFPEPRTVMNRLYFFEDEVQAWMSARPKQGETAPSSRRRLKGSARSNEYGPNRWGRDQRM